MLSSSVSLEGIQMRCQASQWPWCIRSPDHSSLDDCMPSATLRCLSTGSGHLSFVNEILWFFSWFNLDLSISCYDDKNYIHIWPEAKSLTKLQVHRRLLEKSGNLNIGFQIVCQRYCRWFEDENLCWNFIMHPGMQNMVKGVIMY